MEYSDKAPKIEHAYNPRERSYQRRKLMGARAKAAGALLGVVGILGAGGALEKAMQPKYEPDSFFSGRIEIPINESLNLRESPVVITDHNQPPNTVKWEQVKKVNGVDIQGQKSFEITDALITRHKNEDTPWITFTASVDKGLGLTDELLYINFGPATRDFIKIEQHGSFIKLNDNLNPEEPLGAVTVNPN